MQGQPTVMRALTSRLNKREGKRERALAEPTAAQLAVEIRRYCDAHPHARDSIEGIAWWLTWQRYSTTRRSLESAIDDLVARGLLKSHRLTDGSVVFGCDADCEPKDRKKPPRGRRKATGKRK
jgi:hypothetical protein